MRWALALAFCLVSLAAGQDTGNRSGRDHVTIMPLFVGESMPCGTELVRLIVNFRVGFNAWGNREPAGLDVILHGFCRLDHQRMQSPVNGRSRFDKQWTSEVPLGLQHHGVKVACFFNDDEGELSVRGAEESAVLCGKVS